MSKVSMHKPIHGGKVETVQVRPPIPSTVFDWQAHFPDDEGEGLVGYGSTEAEALKDLCEQLRSARDFWNDQHKTLCEAIGGKA